ncbi:MAG: NlpC/P60 family protein, partial [Eggerthella lenta]|nr:NlpC/P60 family protein [Eggerthella lenta]
SFDCSGLVTWAYRQVGMYLPHQSEAQYAAAARVVSVSEARPGDVLWRYGHVGIAVSAGGSHYVHAPTFNAYVRDTDPLSWAQFTNALQF